MPAGTLNGKVRDREYLRVLGTRLRAMREARNLTQKDVAKLLHCDHSAISRAEGGEMAGHMMTGIEGLLKFASAGHETWFMSFLGAEESATSLRTWQPLVIPGLLQVEGYARQVSRGANPGRPVPEVEQRVAARMARQEILTRDHPAPPMLAVVLGETALRKPVGGREVMRAQLERLVVMAREPNISIQVLLTSSDEPAGVLPPFVLASFAPAEREAVAHMENALDGLTTPDREQVTRLALLFEHLTREALRPGESAQFITEVAGQWT